MLKMISAIITLLSSPAFGSNIQWIENCQLGELELSGPTQVYCSGNLDATAGRITTHGHYLEIYAEGELEMRQMSIEGGSEEIRIHARSAQGDLEITTAGDVELSFTAVSEDYDQKVRLLSPESRVVLVVDGQRLPLEAKEHKLLRL